MRGGLGFEMKYLGNKKKTIDFRIWTFSSN